MVSGRLPAAHSPPRLALTYAEAATSIGVFDDFFREHVAGELRVVPGGRKKLVAVRGLERWLRVSRAHAFTANPPPTVCADVE